MTLYILQFYYYFLKLLKSKILYCVGFLSLFRPNSTVGSNSTNSLATEINKSIPKPAQSPIINNNRSFSTDTHPIIPKKHMLKNQSFFQNQVKSSVLQNTEVHKAVPLSALQSKDSVSIVPWSPHCPEHMSMQQFSEFCSLYAVIVCVKRNIPLSEIIIMHNVSRGHAGDNITNLSSLRRFVPEIAKGFDVRGQFTEQQLKWLSPFLVKSDKEVLVNLAQIGILRKPMRFYELFAMCQLNGQFNVTELQYTHELNPETRGNALNISPNENPDLVQVLIGEDYRSLETFIVSFDVKVTQNVFLKKNTVLGVTDNYVERLTLLHKSLIGYVKTIKPTLSLSLQDDAVNFCADLHLNQQKFEDTNDLKFFRENYNVLYEKYRTLLISQKVGFNFIADLSLKEFNIPEKSKTIFLEAYAFCHSSPTSPLKTHLSHINAYNPILRGELVDALMSFYKEIK